MKGKWKIYVQVFGILESWNLDICSYGSRGKQNMKWYICPTAKFTNNLHSKFQFNAIWYYSFACEHITTKCCERHDTTPAMCKIAKRLAQKDLDESKINFSLCLDCAGNIATDMSPRFKTKSCVTCTAVLLQYEWFMAPILGSCFSFENIFRCRPWNRKINLTQNN